MNVEVKLVSIGIDGIDLFIRGCTLRKGRHARKEENNQGGKFHGPGIIGDLRVRGKDGIHMPSRADIIDRVNYQAEIPIRLLEPGYCG